jgi:hypothetical protein
MPWGSFATWSDVAQDSLIHGVEWGLALTFVAAFIGLGCWWFANLFGRVANP